MKLTNVFHLFNGKGRLPPTSYMARCANQTQSLGLGLFVLMVPVCIILKAETDRMQTAEFYREQHEYRKGEDKLGIFKDENKFGLIRQINPAQPKTEADKQEEFENYVYSLELPKPSSTPK